MASRVRKRREAESSPQEMCSPPFPWRSGRESVRGDRARDRIRSPRPPLRIDGRVDGGSARLRSNRPSPCGCSFRLSGFLSLFSLLAPSDFVDADDTGGACGVRSAGPLLFLRPPAGWTPVPEPGQTGEARGRCRVDPPEICPGFHQQIGQDRSGRRSQILGQSGQGQQGVSLRVRTASSAARASERVVRAKRFASAEPKGSPPSTAETRSHQHRHNPAAERMSEATNKGILPDVPSDQRPIRPARNGSHPHRAP